jgi:cytochrome c oxidase cbb3-type subunit III
MLHLSGTCLLAGLIMGTATLDLSAQGRGIGGPGPDDKQVIDADAAARGRTTYIAECITCHGPKARGTEEGADLMRSIVVLRDRSGSQIGSYLRKGHPAQTKSRSENFTEAEIQELSHFLKDLVNQTLRTTYQIQNVLTGDAKAGAAYFNGDGQCSSCHSPSGDLAGIGKRYEPPTLQQRFLFPTRSLPITVTVTPAAGTAVTGELVRIDDFNVSLREPSGEYQSWKRTPGMKVVKNDPLAAHVELLDKYTDRNIHDLVTYLETLK